jgi:hypothetical protein
MKYNSIGEFFYGLSNRCLGLVILPILLILCAYLGNQYFYTGLPPLKVDKPTLVKILCMDAGIIILLFGISVWIVSTKLKVLRVELSLGNRMAGYVIIALIRFRIFSLMILLIEIGVFLTGDKLFVYLMPIPTILVFTYWPLRSRMVRDLKLKPQEREVLKKSLLGV